MDNRLKQIRKSNIHGKTQNSFAEYLGVSMGNIASYESGRRKPSDAFIKLICNKCGINESWLITGEGEMKIPATREQEIADITAALYEADPDGIQYKVMQALSKLDPDQWEQFNEFIKSLM